jgi:hypothetical protein
MFDGTMVDGATDLPVELKLEAYSFSEASLRLRQDGRADGGSGDQALFFCQGSDRRISQRPDQLRVDVYRDVACDRDAAGLLLELGRETEVLPAD